MKIARIIEYFPPHIGGMERHGLILSQEQIKLGHEVDVYIGIGEKNLLPTIYKMPLQFLPLYSKTRRFWFNLWAYYRIKGNYKKKFYNIIHLHGDFVEAYFGGKLSKKLNIPAILTIHAGLNKKLLKPENKKYFENIKKIICVSQDIAEELKTMDVSADKINVISSGVNLSEFNEMKEDDIKTIKNKYSRPILISVGVLRINKGFNFLINAFKKVIDIFPKAMLLIVGDGSEKTNLMKQAQEISQIKFLGNRSHNEVVRYLKAADIFALASISTTGDREGTPTSIMEAMAAGLPVVATKIGGNVQLVKEDENGILVEEKNSDKLARAVIKLIGDENLRQKMHDKNLEDIKEKDWPTIAKKITNVYSR